MFPLETVRTRLAVDHDKYRGVLTAFRTILAAEGFPALYRVRAHWGFGPHRQLKRNINDI